MSEITISQALRRIKKLKGELKEWTTRVEGAAVYREKTPPAFAWATSFEKLDSLRRELLNLQAGVAQTNATTFIEVDGRKISLTYAVHYLSELKGEIAWVKTIKTGSSGRLEVEDPSYNATYAAAMNRPATYVLVISLPETAKAKLVETLQEKFDKLNDIVEHNNHTTILK